MKVHLEMEHSLAPARIIAALTDFSERRPELWPNLDPEAYKVHEVGDTWAVVTEGSPKPKVWARERYDWSQPNRVAWAVEESNFCKPGDGVSWEVTEAEGGGSRLSIDWERSPSNLKGALLIYPMKLIGRRMIKKFTEKSLDNIQRLEGDS